MSTAEAVPSAPRPRRGATTVKRQPFEPGDAVETYIGAARVTGKVVEYEPGKPRRYPLIVERGAKGSVHEGWVKVDEGRPGRVTFKTDAKGELVTRTTKHVVRIEE